MTLDDKTTATLRTTMPQAWVTFLVWLVGRFGFDFTEQDWSLIVILLPFISGVFYRFAREVEVEFPRIGRVLFGTSKTPHYGEIDPDPN